MAAKLKLKPDPTFTAMVDVRIPGGEVAKLALTFKYRTSRQFSEWAEWLKNPDVSDVDTFMSLVEGWQLDGEPFTRENVEAFMDAYPGSFKDIVKAYSDELFGARQKN